MGAKPDLEIMGFIAREMGVAASVGPWLPDTVFEEIRKTVHGYDMPLPVIATGGAGADHAGQRAHARRTTGPISCHSDSGNGLFSLRDARALL